MKFFHTITKAFTATATDSIQFKKARQSPDKPGSVSFQIGQSSVIYLPYRSPCTFSVLPSIVVPGALRAGYPQHDDGIHELTASRRHSPTITRRLVVSYTTFSSLPQDQQNVFCQFPKGGYFLLPSPTVTNSFYFQKWSALCCPDFPLAYNYASDEPGHCLTISAKVIKLFVSRHSDF